MKTRLRDARSALTELRDWMRDFLGEFADGASVDEFVEDVSSAQSVHGVIYEIVWHMHWTAEACDKHTGVLQVPPHTLLQKRLLFTWDVY